jgi:hypothetical protein
MSARGSIFDSAGTRQCLLHHCHLRQNVNSINADADHLRIYNWTWLMKKNSRSDEKTNKIDSFQGKFWIFKMVTYCIYLWDKINPAILKLNLISIILSSTLSLLYLIKLPQSTAELDRRFSRSTQNNESCNMLLPNNSTTAHGYYFLALKYSLSRNDKKVILSVLGSISSHPQSTLRNYCTQ